MSKPLNEMFARMLACNCSEFIEVATVGHFAVQVCAHGCGSACVWNNQTGKRATDEEVKAEMYRLEARRAFEFLLPPKSMYGCVATKYRR